MNNYLLICSLHFVYIIDNFIDAEDRLRSTCNNSQNHLFIIFHIVERGEMKCGGNGTNFLKLINIVKIDRLLFLL